MRNEEAGRALPVQLHPGMHIHLVGIGGFGLSAVARVLLGQGYTVSGSDQEGNELTRQLAAEGARVSHGHRAENVAGADLVLVSAAIPEGNVEVTAGRSQGIPIVKRGALIGALMSGKVGIGVAGTHGKTTTTAMIAQILVEAGRDPSVIVGGVLPVLQGNARVGQSDLFVVEADEYDHMFLELHPDVAVITNLEHDHPDLFPTEEAYREAFGRFVESLPADGRLIYCADDVGAAGIAADAVRVRTIGYGLTEGEWRAEAMRPNQLGGTDFVIQRDDELVGLARLRVPGLHNVRNALAAAVVASALDVPFHQVRQSLGEFGGVGRRFQIVGQVGDVTVIDDYAHHPTEIRATLEAARQRFPEQRIWAVWQPHTFSRTKTLLTQFAASFEEADRVVALAIYRSREQDDLGIDTPAVLRAMSHTDAHYLPTVDEAAGYILDRVRPGDVIITLTAGDGNRVGRAVLDGLTARTGGRPPALGAAPPPTGSRHEVTH